ncbi:MAG: hypothetical protein Q9157_003590 [Trypethelium eluteriae]
MSSPQHQGGFEPRSSEPSQARQNESLTGPTEPSSSSNVVTERHKATAASQAEILRGVGSWAATTSDGSIRRNSSNNSPPSRMCADGETQSEVGPQTIRQVLRDNGEGSQHSTYALRRYLSERPQESGQVFPWLGERREGNGRNA